MNSKLLFFASIVTLLSFNAFSQIEWINSTGGDEWDCAYQIAIDETGNSYVIGHFNSTVDLDPGPIDNTVSTEGQRDILVQKFDPFGNLIWAKTIGSNDSEEAKSIVIGNSGNIYITGDFQATLDFDPGIGISDLTPQGITDVFVWKIDSAGNHIWAKSFTGGSSYNGGSIAADSDENIYVTGYFFDSTDFDPGPANFYLASNGSGDIFIEKMDSSGNFIWAKAIGSTYYDQGYGIEVDEANNVYVSGRFRGTVDFDPSALGIYNLIAPSSQDAFTVKLNEDGDFIWAESSAAGISDVLHSIVTDGSGNLYSCGSFDPGSFPDIPDMYIEKRDTSGTILWSLFFGAGAYDQCVSLAIDDQDNIYITGSYGETVDFESGPESTLLTSTASNDIFVLKIDPFGNMHWAKTTASNTSVNIGQSIVIGPDGSIFLTGQYRGTTNFDFGGNNHALTSMGDADIFVLKMSAQSGLAENEEPQNVLIYPNPATETLNILTTEVLTEISIFDIHGKMVLTFSRNLAYIDISGLESGIYFVQTSSENGTIVQQKLVVN
jgi:hypothetical protein